MTCSQKVDLPLPGAPISNTTMGFPCPSPSVYNSLILLSKMDHVDDFWKTLKSETQKKKKKPLEVGSQSISAILEVSFKSSRMAKLPVVFTEVSA